MLVAVAILQILPIGQANAAQITNRSLTLQGNGVNTNGSAPGAAVNHLYTFTLPTSASLGSVKFEYCTTAANSPSNPACVTPTGLSTTSATLGNQTGQTGFTINNATQGAPYLTRTAAAGSGNVTFRLDNVTNPSAANQTFFVRISTYASTDTTGSSTDLGTVTASTARPIILDGTMPESLVFCTGETISLLSSVPDCSTATDGSVSFNQLFSPTDTAVASSQMAASTNAGFGYVVTVNGPTMTSGSNTVTALNTAAASLKGVSQFGLNLKTNTSAAAASFPGNSAELAAVSNGTNYNGRAVGDYATADTFAYVNGAIVADSNFDGAGSPGPTDAQIYTASYIVNVPGSQPAGTYTTTLTYICTPAF